MRNIVLVLGLVLGLALAACGMQTQPESISPPQEMPALSATQQPSPVVPTPETPAATHTAGVETTLNTAPEIIQGEASALALEALKNASFSGIFDEPIILTDGLYEGEPYVQGDPARPTVEYIDGAELYGDLDGDSVEDAVVFLIERGGGSGAFMYVAAQLNRDGQPVDAGAILIEDRVGIQSAVIKDGQIVLDVITQGPGDAACCSTHKAQKTYTYQNRQLIETTAEDSDLVRVLASDLTGTTWRLLELDRDQPALAGDEVTLSFMDGQLGGSGGCNSYTGSLSLSSENPFVMTIGPIAATQKSCSDPSASQENTYLAALGAASRWNYVFGKLALYYPVGQNAEGRLLFSPQVPAEAKPIDLLAAQPWQWVSFTNPVEQYALENPQNYVLTFNEDGSVNIVADCNNAAGSYTTDSKSLTIQVGPMTMAACPPGSRSDQFVKYLGFAANYFFQDGNLFIDLFADGGTLEFAPAVGE